MARDSIGTAVFAAGRACIQGGGRKRQTWSELCHWRLVCVAINMKYHTSNARRWSGLRLSYTLRRDFVPKFYFDF